MRRHNRARRSFGMRPVDSTKSYVQFSSNVNHGVRVILDLAVTYRPEEFPGGAPGVLDGCKIPSIEIHVRGIANNATNILQNQIFCLYKQEAGQADIAVADLQSIDSFAQKRMVLHFDQLNAYISGPGMEWHLRFKLPRSVHKFEKVAAGANTLGDRLRLAIMNNDPANDNLAFCGFAVYKWYK